MLKLKPVVPRRHKRATVNATDKLNIEYFNYIALVMRQNAALSYVTQQTMPLKFGVKWDTEVSYFERIILKLDSQVPAYRLMLTPKTQGRSLYDSNLAAVKWAEREFPSPLKAMIYFHLSSTTQYAMSWVPAESREAIYLHFYCGIQR